MTIGEGRRGHPRVERILITPAGDDQPLITTISGLEQLEPLEAVLTVDGASTGSKPVGEFVTGLGRHSDGVDADDRHG